MIDACSARAIELAHAVRALRALDEGPELQGARITFQVDDMLSSVLPTASFALMYASLP